jgi:DNA-directed RNA polymerase subunit alpha
MLDPLFQIRKEKETSDSGKFIIEPLEKGYGHTLGNSLRRVLLTSLPGAAVTHLKIQGVRHRFSTLEGLKEDIIEFILNVKQLQIRYDGKKPAKLNLDVVGPREVKAGDIETPAKVEIINKDHVLGNLADKKSKLRVEMVVEPGYGYLPAHERKSEKLGVIPVDASFTPIRMVNYKVESTRVGRRTDLDCLILEIETNGTIKPSEALKKAANILLEYFQQVVSPKKAPKVKEKEDVSLARVLELTVEELDLPTRIANALRKGGYDTLGTLTAATREDLTKVKNLGEKSIKIVEGALKKKKVTLKKK